jgi:hypothetical protein
MIYIISETHLRLRCQKIPMADIHDSINGTERYASRG